MTSVKNRTSKQSQQSVTTSKPWVVLKLGAGSDSDWITYGPYSSSEVKKQLRSGILKATDYCWKKDFSDWVRIYLEPEFYSSRKPPIEISPSKSMTAGLKNQASDDSEALDSKANSRSFLSEIADKISPIQYKGWKYKKPLKDKAKPIYPNQQNKKSGAGVLSMLEPWDHEVKNLDFEEESSSTWSSKAKALGLDTKEPLAKSKSKKPLKVFIGFGMFVIVLMASYRLYTIFNTENTINYSMSYFVIEDYLNELPEYMYARTDLKKNEQIKIRVFDLKNKQVRTKAKKAGIMLTSKGTGRMRIPMYVYDLSPGIYKIVIEIQDQQIQKDFVIVELNPVEGEATKTAL